MILIKQIWLGVGGGGGGGGGGGYFWYFISNIIDGIYMYHKIWNILL